LQQGHLSFMSSSKIKVLIIDDSALVREVLSEVLNTDPELEVVGTASDPFIARNKIKQLNPDVLTLDVEMPRMDGLTFLGNLMRLRPMPVVMVSSLTENGADITLRALEMGAVDFVSKPKLDVAHGLKEYADELCEKVRTAAGAKLQNYRGSSPAPDARQLHSADAVLDKRAASQSLKTTDKIIAIGASTGGTEAIKEVLMQMPADAPGTVITQHIPKAFSAPFARRMDDNCAMTVYEASDGQQILPGHVYIAPGDQHMLIERSGARYMCRLNDGPPVNRHRPAVDVMFRSVAQNVAANAIGIILTGMGDDGAAGLKEMHDAGARTIAQDERTSVVWGMPGEAIKQGGVDDVLPLQAIPSHFMRLLK
jgi:two-component system chemotaxis response regulator CheB